MQIRGKIISISGDIAEVCIIKENTTCGSCSTCLKKMGIRDIVKVAAIKGIQVDQEVVLRRNLNWFVRNRSMFILIAFVFGIIITEAMSTAISFGAYRGGIDLLGGGVLTIILLVVLWIKRPRFPFRIERVEGGRT